MKVMCTHGGTWKNMDTGKPTEGPKKDEVCKVIWSTQSKKYWNRTFISLEGYEHFGLYPLSCFRPIVDDFGDTVCKRIEETIKEKELV